MTAQKKEKARANEPSQQTVPIETITSSELTTQIAAAEKAKAKLPIWDRGKRDAAESKLSALRLRLEASELRGMPMPDRSAATQKFKERDVAIADIRRTGNHRETTDEAATVRLARTLQTLGLQQRIGLRDLDDGGFELIFGSRRLTAAESIGWLVIPAKVFPSTLTAAEVEIIRTVENFGRQELTHVERAIAVARVIDSIEGMQLALTGEDSPAAERSRDLESAIETAGGLHSYVGQQLGFPAKWVRDNAYVSRLGGRTRELLAEHRLDIGHARELAKLGDPQVADTIAGYVARNEQGLGGESVDRCRQHVTEHMRSLRIVPWRLDVAFGSGVKGCTGQACSTCPFNSKSDPDLFGGAIADEPEAGVCTNEACYTAKQTIAAKDVEKATAKVVKFATARTGTVVNDSLAQQYVPIHLKPATVARKAKKQIDASAAAAGSDESSSVSKSATPEQKALTKLEIKLGEWERTVSDALLEACREDQSRIVLLSLLSGRDVLPRTYGPDRDDAIATGVKIIVEAIDSAGHSLIKAMMKDKRWEPDFMSDARAEWLQPFVVPWGLQVPAMPVLGDFLPRPKAATRKTSGTTVDTSALSSDVEPASFDSSINVDSPARSQKKVKNEFAIAAGEAETEKLVERLGRLSDQDPNADGLDGLRKSAIRAELCQRWDVSDDSLDGEIANRAPIEPDSDPAPKKRPKPAGTPNPPTDPFHQAKNRDAYEKVPVAAVLKTFSATDAEIAKIFKAMPDSTTLGEVEDWMAFTKDLTVAVAGLDRKHADILADVIRKWFEPPTQEQVEEAGAAQGRIDGTAVRRQRKGAA